MKGQLLITVFFGVIGVGLAMNRTESELPYVKECVNELGEGDLHSMFVRANISITNLFCVRACVWTKIGFLKDAKMDFPKLEEYLTETEGPEKKTLIINIIKECQAISERGNDPCAVAYYYATCYKLKVDEQLGNF